MKKWGKKALIGVAIVIVVAAVAFSKMQPLEVETGAVTKGKVTATVVEKGKVVSGAMGDIFSEVQGKVKEVYVDEGAAVTKGKVLALVDTAEVEARIAQLEGELKAIKGMEQVSPADGNLIKQQLLAVEQNRVAYNQAKSNYERIRNLYDQEAATTVELERAQNELETTQKALAQAEAALASARQQSQGNKQQYQGQRESIQAQLDHLREQQAKARIMADRNGTIFVKKVKKGDFISHGSFLFTLGTSGQVKIETYVNSKDMANINPGDRVTVIFKVPGQDLEVGGDITKIAPVTEERTSALGVIEDKVKVTVELKKYPPGIKLIPGMTVDVVLVTQEADNALGVPKEAVFTDRGDDFVWTVKDGRAVVVQVETGVEGDDLIEVKKGLDSDDELIMNPQDR
nr:efflux RND transporter periplasmic adaptor subunit [Clostridia bacterium]